MDPQVAAHPDWGRGESWKLRVAGPTGHCHLKLEGRPWLTICSNASIAESQWFFFLTVNQREKILQPVHTPLPWVVSYLFSPSLFLLPEPPKDLRTKIDNIYQALPVCQACAEYLIFLSHLILLKTL